jgi:hypothetical protein
MTFTVVPMIHCLRHIHWNGAGELYRQALMGILIARIMRLRLDEVIYSIGIIDNSKRTNNFA